MPARKQKLAELGQGIEDNNCSFSRDSVASLKAGQLDSSFQEGNPFHVAEISFNQTADLTAILDCSLDQTRDSLISHLEPLRITDSVLDFTTTDLEPVDEELAAIKARFEEACTFDDSQIQRAVRSQTDLEREIVEAKQRVRDL